MWLEQNTLVYTILQVVPFDGTVYTFGFGADHDASLLEAISQAAEGSYYYIDSAEKVHIFVVLST